MPQLPLQRYVLRWRQARVVYALASATTLQNR